MFIPNRQQALDTAMADHRAGRMAEAEAGYRQLLSVTPGDPELLHLLGILAGQTGHPQDAVNLISRAIASQPANPVYRSNLAVWLLQLGRLDDAACEHEAAIRVNPGFVQPHFNLALIRMKQRQWLAAADSYRRVITLQPDIPEAHLNLGLALSNSGLHDDSLVVLRDAAARFPREARLWNNLGHLLCERDELDEAVAAFRTAIACDPTNAEIHSNLGNALKNQGLHDAAIASYHRSLSLDPSKTGVWSNLIFALLFHPNAEPKAIIAEQQRWAQGLAAPLRSATSSPAVKRENDGPLRIGFVSPDFCGHPVGRLLLPLFAGHDRRQLEFICYSDSIPDTFTEQLRPHAALWRDTLETTDNALAAQIRADRIDILFDLALHTAGNRMLVFARKPAPVQVSWLGYAGDSGLDAIDFRLSDPRMDPPGADSRVVRLPDTWCCYRPHGDPAPAPEMPAARNGFITFGSFNAFAKTTPQALALWARLLHEAEGSRLLMLAPSGSMRERTLGQFQNLGVARERISFLPRGTPSEYFQRYSQIDLALDTFPFNGMTTTCDALWMGVPVVTLIGRQPLSRTAFSILSTVGLQRFCASTPEEYIRIATECARDLPQLAILRSALRARMQASPLMDAPRFTRNFTEACQTMWRQVTAPANDEAHS